MLDSKSAIDTDHGAGRSDQFGCQERHVAGGAADVQDVHAGADFG
jgi:hypothetical protein